MERKQREVFYEWKENEENWFYKGVLLLAKGVNPISTKLLLTPLSILKTLITSNYIINSIYSNNFGKLNIGSE